MYFKKLYYLEGEIIANKLTRSFLEKNNVIDRNNDTNVMISINSFISNCA